jgi:hypothetical protein
MSRPEIDLPTDLEMRLVKELVVVFWFDMILDTQKAKARRLP